MGEVWETLGRLLEALGRLLAMFSTLLGEEIGLPKANSKKSSILDGFVEGLGKVLEGFWDGLGMVLAGFGSLLDALGSS